MPRTGSGGWSRSHSQIFLIASSIKEDHQRRFGFSKDQRFHESICCRILLIKMRQSTLNCATTLVIVALFGNSISGAPRPEVDVEIVKSLSYDYVIS